MKSEYKNAPHPPPQKTKTKQKQTTNIPTHKNPPKDKSFQNYSYKVKDILILFICFNELLCKNKKNTCLLMLSCSS